MDISNSTCSEMEQALDAYLDLELEPEAAQAVERHLETCSACALRLKELELLVERLQSLPAAVLSRDLADDIGDRIMAQKTTPTSVESSGQVVDIATARAKRSFAFSRPLAYAASFILVAVAGSYFIGGLNIAQQGSKTSSQIASNQLPSTSPAVDSTRAGTAATKSTDATSGSSSVKSASPVVTGPAHIAALPDAVGLARPASSSHSATGTVPGSTTTTGAGGKSSSSVIASSSSPDKFSKATASDNSGLTKPAEADDLIADYGDPVVDGVYDFGISTNEDGLYAIKL